MKYLYLFLSIVNLIANHQIGLIKYFYTRNKKNIKIYILWDQDTTLSKPSVDPKIPEVLPEALYDLEIVGIITVSGYNLDLTTYRLFPKVFRLVYLDFPFLITEWVNGKHKYLDERLTFDPAHVELSPSSEMDMTSMLGNLVKKSNQKSKIETNVCRSAFFYSENIMIDFIYMMQGKVNKIKLSKIDDWLISNITECDESARTKSYMWIIHRYLYWNYDGQEPDIKFIYNKTMTSLSTYDAEVVRNAHRYFKLLHMDEENRYMVTYFLNFWLLTKDKQKLNVINRTIYGTESTPNSENFRIIRTNSLGKEWLLTAQPLITCSSDTIRFNYELANYMDITVKRNGLDWYVTMTMDHYQTSINFVYLFYYELFRFIKDFLVISNPRLYEGKYEIHTINQGSIYLEVIYKEPYVRHKDLIQLNKCGENKVKRLLDKVIEIAYEQRCIKESRDNLKMLRMFQQKVFPIEQQSYNLYQFIFSIHQNYNVQKWINIVTLKDIRPFNFNYADRIETLDHMKLTCRYILYIRRFLTTDMISDMYYSIRKYYDERMMFNKLDIESDDQIKKPPGYNYYLCTKQDTEVFIDKMQYVCGSQVYNKQKLKEHSVPENA